MDTEKIYNQLLPKLEELEKQRLEVFAKTERTKKLSMIVTGIIVLAFLFIGQWMVSLFAAGIGLTVFTILYHRFRKEYAQNYKEEILKSLIESLGPGYSFDANGQIPEDALRKCGLFHEFNKTKGEDLISGKFDDYQFEMAEMNLWLEKTSKKADRGSSTIFTFKGLVFVGNIKQSFPAPIWLLSKNTTHKGLKDRLQKDWKRVVTNHKAFNEEYQVFSTNTDIAKKLLPENIQENIIRSKEEINPDMPMEFAFIENQVFISISTTVELFEPPIKTSVKDPELFKENIRYLKGTTGLLQQLTLVK